MSHSRDCTHVLTSHALGFMVNAAVVALILRGRRCSLWLKSLIRMVFPFTFKLNIPGLVNPFTKSHQTPTVSTSHDSDMNRNRAVLQKITRPRPRPSPSPSPSPAPLSRKRGWEPSFAEPSQSTTTLASTAGYLDTPAKYRQQLGVSAISDEYHNITMSDSPDQDHDQEQGTLQLILESECCVHACMSPAPHRTA